MAFEIYERASFRGAMISGLAANADSLGLATAASLAFDDKKFAEEMLGTIRSERYVMAVILYDKRGKVFAEYRRSDLGAEFKTPTWKDEGTKFDSESLTLYRNISADGERSGFIAIVSDLSALQSKMREYRGLSVLVLLVSILITFVISSRLVGLITQPILMLAEVTGRVSAQKDYTLRAVSASGDEVGKLVEAFNQMLAGIQERDAALQSAKDQLEIRVQQRTEELRNEVKEREEAEAAMRLAKDAAEKASNAKSEFLANMSHEIRTPLNGVMGMTDLALDTSLTSEQREYLETVKSSSEALLVVINDILDFSKIEAGRIELESADFDLRDCLESALRTVAIRADEKGLELLCEVAPEAPEVVKGDAGRLRQVIINLVGNAIKFTDGGEVAVRVQPDAQNGSEGVLHFTVSDTGIGIPADKCEAIFAPFTQA
ncbi:MAG TPA: histidine kinase dimerization/phospho-acceptor domain-containing protein, partial [Candidatus Sulfotelmatobacter sp.]|nr:histidine kinase dimerization/phospho-acceptor domain-containing protein [Candidatus Sulfotelmatobacter sp.]